MTADVSARELHPSADDALAPAQLRALYRAMLRLRTVDERMMTLQRQGRIGFYGACTGQEAAALASAFALAPTDWIFPALREAGAMLLRGYPLVPYISQLFGNALDVQKGRQMPSHQMDRRVNQVSWGSCIGSQLPHAVGAAFAAKLTGRPDVMLAYLGDGATSSSDFHSAMTFAAVWKAPVVFVCQNNHWSISVPTHQQTAARTLADKALGYGMPGRKIDGNDAPTVYAATREAVERARRGDGPTFIEAETYRIGAHSSSDDPTRYRDEAEVELWRGRDPLVRMKAHVTARAGWTEAEDESLRAALLAEVNAALAEAEAAADPAPATLFDDVYAVRPWHLDEQRAGFLAGP
jgi:pyruvate dehydrogenase E1 component alpha subunit/2-oxoisovalerate dehydrogenase E1 component alpha subunit